MQTESRGVDPQEDPSAEPAVRRPSLAASVLKGFLGGLKWSVLLALLLNALRLIGLAWEGKWQFSLEEFLITFMIVPVWVTVTSFIGLVQGLQARAASSKAVKPSLAKHLVVGAISGLIPGLFVIPFVKHNHALELVQSLGGVACIGALIGFAVYQFHLRSTGLKK